MEKEYLLSFSSFYKAAYAKDVLEQHGLRSSLRKLPPQIAHSCSTGVYLRIDSIARVQKVLGDNEIIAKGYYEIRREGNGKTYIRV